MASSAKYYSGSKRAFVERGWKLVRSSMTISKHGGITERKKLARFRLAVPSILFPFTSESRHPVDLQQRRCVNRQSTCGVIFYQTMRKSSRISEVRVSVTRPEKSNNISTFNEL